MTGIPNFYTLYSIVLILPLPLAVRELFPTFLFPVISNEVRNLLEQSRCIQMLQYVQHDSWIGGPRFSDRLSRDNNGKLHWFVLHVSYGRATQASDLLNELNTKIFNPLHKEESRWKASPDAFTTASRLTFCPNRSRDPQHHHAGPYIRSLISYYYDHFHQAPNGYIPLLDVPDGPMYSFMKALTADSHDVRVVKPNMYATKMEILSASSPASSRESKGV